MKQNIKIISSCVRNIERKIILDSEVSVTNKIPEIGDLILCNVAKIGNYSKLEDVNHDEVLLKENDLIICVIGNRFSGTNIYGKVPNHILQESEEIDLLSIGGVVGNCIDENKEKTTKLNFKGYLFFNNTIINTKNFSIGSNNFSVSDYDNFSNQLITVCGTSADVGKTTLAKNIINVLRKQNNTVAAIKIYGTGRLRDKNNFIKAGANISFDFTDFGYPSTYGISFEEYSQLVINMINEVKNNDYVVIEIGGDLLEPNVKRYLNYLNIHNNKFFLVVNDAMGAETGIKIIKNNPAVFTWKQNVFSLKKRINYKNVYSFNEQYIYECLNN